MSLNGVPGAHNTALNSPSQRNWMPVLLQKAMNVAQTGSKEDSSINVAIIFIVLCRTEYTSHKLVFL